MNNEIKPVNIKREIFSPEKIITNASKRRKIDCPTPKTLQPKQNKNSVKDLNDNNQNELKPCTLFSPEASFSRFPDVSDGIYRSPKAILNNTFGQIANRFKNKNLRLTPNYNMIQTKKSKLTWCCSYMIQWPSQQLFKQTAENKKKATHEAALSVLLWLRSNKHITRDGTPIITDDKCKEFAELQMNLYSAPKAVLHNALNKVSVKLHNNNLNVKPSFNVVEVKNAIIWSCKYTLNWPELREFETVGKNKKEASEEAALSTLLWLKNNSKITETGFPIIPKKKEKSKKCLRKLCISQKDLQLLKNIVLDYEEGFLENSNVSEEPAIVPKIEVKDEIELTHNFQCKFLGIQTYLGRDEPKLPISQFKDQILNLVNKNRVVIIKGEPGCGKSTRVPQYILESWAKSQNPYLTHFRVAVTQPRRIAAISLAERVAEERQETCGPVVGYQIRLNSNFVKKTGRILYCTNGILLRHLQSDPTLPNFSHIILDEAHERDANTDLLMLLLRRTLSVNPNLKIIVMSATINTDLFQSYFHGAVVINIPGFTYPVQSYYLDDLPANLKLEKSIRNSQNLNRPNVLHEDVAKVINFIHKNKPPGAILCFLPGWDDISKTQNLIPIDPSIELLCLHSKIHDSDQKRIFLPTSPGIRKVILSTNIAETSVTINDVVYVIDTGIHKESRFDNVLGVTCVDSQWVSQASVLQRRGRAGRVQSGESYHLFTREKFEKMAEFTDPEILRIPLTKIVLDLKVYCPYNKSEDIMNELLTPPEKLTIHQSVQTLKDLELFNENETLTDLGKILSQFQLHPKLAKVLINSVIFKCVTPIVDVVTIFSNETDLFSNSLFRKEEIRKVKEKTICTKSDHLSLMMLFEYWLQLMEESGEYAAKFFCEDSNLVHENLHLIQKLRQIHFDYLYKGLYSSFKKIFDDYSDNDELVKAVLFNGTGTLLRTESKINFSKGRHCVKDQLLNNGNHNVVLSSDSVNFKQIKSGDLLVYINEVRSNTRNVNTVRECSTLTPLALLLFSNKELLVTVENQEAALKLKDTNIEFSTTKIIADIVVKCKTSIQNGSKYMINEVIKSGTFPAQLETYWNNILENLNKLLAQKL